MSHTLRTRFCEDIVAEFMPPAHDSNRVVIFADGMPSLPHKKWLLRLFSKWGFWVFHPRYRGSWESGGTFLDHDPTEDILDVVREIKKGVVTSVWDGVEYTLDAKQIYVIGASFGGPAAILSSKSELVDKIIAISPVVDWPSEQLSVDEPMDWLEGAVNRAFGNAYRFSTEDWKRLSDGAFYNPMSEIDTLDKDKVLVIHTMDDTVVLPGPVQEFSERLDCAFLLLKKGGHVPKRIWKSWWLRRKVLSFLS